MLKGALHVHSTYSDGEFTLAELRRTYEDDGCAFVCMTDHAEALDPDKLRQYVDECQALSDERLLFVAGMEYECERRMHILGYGATERVDSQDPETVIRHIEEQGVPSVIAHPKNDFFDWIRKFETLPLGIETWNSKYDGRYGARPETFRAAPGIAAAQTGNALLLWSGSALEKAIPWVIHADRLRSHSQEHSGGVGQGAFTGIKGELSLRLPASWIRNYSRNSAMRMPLLTACGNF